MKKCVYIAWMVILGILVTSYLAGYRMVFASGDSMLPTLKEKQICIAKEIDDNELCENDIGIFWDPNNEKWINHRVIYKTKAGYIFKGDNNISFDEFVPKEFVKYKVIWY